MNLTFRIQYRTVWGESLQVIFNENENQTCQLSTRNGIDWQGECTYTPKDQHMPICYRYGVFRDNICIRKELGAIPHLFYAGNAQQNHYIINDCWRDLPFDNYRYTSAFNIIHELTSPIHSINGFSQAILEGLGGDVNDKQEKYLKIINKNSTQLLELINSLVEYSKLESGFWDYEFKNFDFVNLMTNLFNTYKPKAEEKKLILNFDLNSLGKRSIYSDENALKRILETLVQNAINITESGAVQVVVNHPDTEYLEIAGFNVSPNMPDKSYLMIKIIDNGPGIPENELNNIFDPYANIEKYIAKKAVAKSLELGIIYNLVRILKGKMWVETESMKGSTFAFIIPIERVTI